MAPKIAVLAGRKVELSDDKQEVIDMLRRVADKIESGEAPATSCLLITMDMSEVDEFTANVSYVGRATNQFAAIEMARDTLMHDMIG